MGAGQRRLRRQRLHVLREALLAEEGDDRPAGGGSAPYIGQARGHEPPRLRRRRPPVEVLGGQVLGGQRRECGGRAGDGPDAAHEETPLAGRHARAGIVAQPRHEGCNQFLALGGAGVRHQLGCAQGGLRRDQAPARIAGVGVRLVREDGLQDVGRLGGPAGLGQAAGLSDQPTHVIGLFGDLSVRRCRCGGVRRLVLQHPRRGPVRRLGCGGCGVGQVGRISGPP